MARNSVTARTVGRRPLILSAPLIAAGALGMRPALAGDGGGNNIDITGYVPDLSFDMTDVNTGRTVTAADFRGTFTLLYFGYAQCPDICPLTLQRVAQVFDKMGKDAAQFRLLFVTVDPGRDTTPILKQYVQAFSPLFVGLRGDDNAIARLARRYRIAYSVTPAGKAHLYEVTHSSAIYVFDRTGAPKLLLTSLASTQPDIDGTANDLERLVHQAHRGMLSRLLAVL